MLVGYTHDNINALFRRWVKKLKRNDYSKMLLLNKTFMDVEHQPIILHLIEEVPDIKGIIDASIGKQKKSLDRYIAAQQFKFYADIDGWPMMHYKKYCTDVKWLLKENGTTHLWNKDNCTKPMLSIGQYMALFLGGIRNLDKIVKVALGFISMWKSSERDDITKEYQRINEHLI
jgi:hypothetical protein